MVRVHEKQTLTRQLVTCLKCDKRIRKIIISGPFLDSDDPGDMDAAVFQESRKGYLEPGLKYRKMAGNVAVNIPVDFFPVRTDVDENFGSAGILLENNMLQSMIWDLYTSRRQLKT